MDKFRQDYDLQGAIVGSTVSPHTLRFPGYDGDDIGEIEAYKKSIESGIRRKIIIPDIRTDNCKPQVISESNVEDIIKTNSVLTQMRDRAIALLTADCSPILLYAPGQGVIGGMHGSSKAIADDVIENTFTLLEDNLGVMREDVRVYVGPTICQDHYEVGESYVEGFQDINIKTGELGKAYLDIRGEVVYRLGEQGVKGTNIISPQECTYGGDKLFSFRRKTHLEKQNKPFTHANNGNLIWFSE